MRHFGDYVLRTWSMSKYYLIFLFLGLIAVLYLAGLCFLRLFLRQFFSDGLFDLVVSSIFAE